MASYTGKAEIYVNGRIQGEAQSVDVTVKNNATKLGTLQKGFVGHADGAAECTISIKSIVPLAGFETNFEKLVNTQATVEVVVKQNKADKVRAKGRFTEAAYSSSFNGETTINATFDGYAPTFG